MDYAAKGTTYTALGLSIGSLATQLLGGNLGNLFGGVNTNNGGGYVTKDMLDMSMKMAAKDSEIALLKSEASTEIKVADVYERLSTKINANKAEQDAINREQAVYNATNTATVSVISNQVNDLRAILGGLTVTHIPAANVCPEPMPLKNSWTAPTT